jgi:TIR domain
MRKIFISYRRVDAEFPAGALGRDLRRLFGDEQVFRDKEDVGGGVSWRKEVLHEINRDCALLVLIGRDWANAKDAHGKRRLDNSDDPIRLEIADGIRDGAMILPILLENAAMPSEEELRPLAEYNALKLRDGDWQYDLDKIRRTLQKGGFKPVNSLPPAPPQGRQSITPGSARQKSNIVEIIPYALIALASFLCGIGVLGLMLWKAEALTKLGLIGNLYYVVLLPLGLCAAVFLFGVVRSFARYKGEHYGGNLELGGPIVAFVLVVGGGFVLVPKPPSTFPLTVYVHGETARNDLVLRNSGRVFIDLDGDRQSRSIGENGEAYFPAIPDRFRGQEVPIWVDATGFESTVGDQQQRVDGGSLYLPVRKKGGHVSGRVQDQDGNPISGAELSVAGVLTHSDESGHFEFIIPGAKLEQEMDLQAVAHGHKSQKYKVVPNANELSITLPTAP